jgi:hypothetical protein
VLGDPAGVVVISPSTDDDVAVFGNVETMDHRKDIFEAELHGPYARVPTHRQRRYRRHRKARYRPAGLGFDRAGKSPARRNKNFQSSSFLSFQQVPGRTNKLMRTFARSALFGSLCWSNDRNQVGKTIRRLFCHSHCSVRR